jgi:hypothetical protein
MGSVPKLPHAAPNALQRSPSYASAEGLCVVRLWLLDDEAIDGDLVAVTPQKQPNASRGKSGVRHACRDTPIDGESEL